MRAVKNVLAFLLTVFVGIGVGSVLAVVEDVELENKKRHTSSRSHSRG